MIPAGLVNDAKKLNSFHKGERKVVRKNTQKAAFIRSSDEMASFNSVIPSGAPSVAGTPVCESARVSLTNPPLPTRKMNLETSFAPENAFKHQATAKKVLTLSYFQVEHIVRQKSIQKDADFSFIYPTQDESAVQDIKERVFENMKTPLTSPGVLYTNLEAEDMKLVTTHTTPAASPNQKMHISLKPTNRKEVAILKHTMVNLLRGLGVAEETEEYPTDMHAFLSVIQEEQKIYDSVFQEIIRQVTVNMSERGEILSEIQMRYSTMFAKVPKHVRHLHTELVAQRKLNKRLTEELLKSKVLTTSLLSRLQFINDLATK
jgi:hypothetical protein